MLWALVMAGGQGTRFWPESRAKNPKQFLRVMGKKSLLEQTIARIRPVIPPGRILVVTQESKMRDAARHARIPGSNIIGEPVGRNTAPCAALAAALILKKDPAAILAILPSDHHIEKSGVFSRALKAAGKIADKRRLPVTFGIEPDFPHTGYGYLEITKQDGTAGGFKVYRLKRFHEKPDLKKAKAFLKTKRFYWNSGMFVWRADELLAAAKKFLPSAWRLANEIAAGSNLKVQMKRHYAKMPDISIDYGLMEKMRGKILMLPVKMGWNDVGDWKTLAKYWPKDVSENALFAKTLMIDSRGNIVKGRERLIVFVGVNDCVVVDTEDALLVCSKHKTEHIRKVVEHIKAKNWHQYL
ncbi:MAG: mannose-1-phosphate guanylyltransferase [Candidatus Omnitrophica bacterium]|nr:mannose-1-phosphate guanylyltransferase [Candidatus Omnitrophota bacterium]